MSKHTLPGDIAPTMLDCEVCLQEIPSSVADHAEADDYVANLCGLSCYQQWRQRSEKQNACKTPRTDSLVPTPQPHQ